MCISSLYLVLPKRKGQGLSQDLSPTVCISTDPVEPQLHHFLLCFLGMTDLQ